MKVYNPKSLLEIREEESKKEDFIDTEKVAMAEAIVNLTLEVENLKQQINGGAV